VSDFIEIGGLALFVKESRQIGNSGIENSEILTERLRQKCCAMLAVSGLMSSAFTARRCNVK
jgi:hypothetical protein